MIAISACPFSAGQKGRPTRTTLVIPGRESKGTLTMASHRLGYLPAVILLYLANCLPGGKMRRDVDHVGRGSGLGLLARCCRGAFGILLAIGFFAVSASAASAATDVTLWVSTAGTATTVCTGTGTSACKTITDAIAAAEQLTTDDVTIDVAAGTYDENLAIQDSGNVGYTLTINGAGSTATILDGAKSGTDIAVSNNTNVAVTISGLEIADGSGYDSDLGGAVLNAATLTLKNDEFLDDSAEEGGAVYNEDGATVTLADDTFLGIQGSFGGAVDNLGTATLTDDTVSGMSGEEGGVLYNNTTGTATLTDDTFSADSADYGGAVDNLGTVSLTNDTLSGDSATEYGGGIYNTSTATVFDDTFANDSATVGGGGLLNYTLKSLTVTATILDSAPCTYISGYYPIVDGGYNVESDDSCGFGGSTSKVDSTTIDLASTLAANGSKGPDTVALGVGSSAIGVVPQASCTVATDERGMHRPGTFDKTSCDAGAYEFQTTVPSAPQHVSAKRGNESITIKWSAPSSNGGLAISGYRLFCGKNKSVSTKGTPTAKPSAKTTSTKVSKLKNGTEYYCVVVATNAEGSSRASSTVHATPKA